MREVLLCKYGELVLKGANRSTFEAVLLKELKIRAKCYGHFAIEYAQSTIYIRPLDDDCDMDGMFEAAKKVFGLVGISRCAVCKKEYQDIADITKAYIPSFLDGYKTFKVEAKRADKTFPLDSMQIAAEIGGEILSVCPKLRVDVHNPDITVRVEIRENGAYVHAGQAKGAGGMPRGTAGNGLVLLSGGIDSPVAGFMMAKRGMRLNAVHFESFPYTSELAKDKVLRLAKLVAGWAGPINVHVVSLTKIQEALVAHCEEDYFTLLLRRYMMAIADKIAEQTSCKALITGESLGQVASQTLEALCVTDILATRPVFRPCIGMDKEEIIEIARRIGTFETSIEPFEDCCTVFTPKHPRTKPELEKVLAEERKLDFDILVDEAVATMTTERIYAQY